MATKIVTKNSSTASSVPTAAQLVQGELAVNVVDKKLYTEDNAGAVVLLADGTKLEGIEALADVTDTANVTAAGALMDSELTSIASVKALDQGVSTTDSPSFDGLTVDGNSVFTTADNSAQVTLVSTDTDALVGPQLNLWRNSGVGTNGDLIGQITFTGEDTVGATNTFATIYGIADQTNNGAEDGSIHFQTLINGSLADRLVINSAGDMEVTGEITASGGIALGDSDKATFGAGDDLLIYHDGSNSYITDAGTGDLKIRSNKIRMEAPDSQNMIIVTEDAGVQAFYNGTVRLSVNDTGIDVTGTATMDGLVSAGTAFVNLTSRPAGVPATAGALWSAQTDTGNYGIVSRASSTDSFTYIGNTGSAATLGTSYGSSGSYLPLDLQTSDKKRLSIASNGDISFYEDTGTTAKFFWDASSTRLTLDGAETSRSSNTYLLDIDNSTQTSNMATSGPFRVKGYYGDSLAITGAGNVGIGTSSPDSLMHLYSSAPFARLESASTAYNGFTTKNDSGNFYFGIDDSGGNFYGAAYARAIYADGAYPVTFYTNAAERMRIDSSGNSIFGSTVTDRTTADGTTIASVGFVDVSRTSAIAGRFTRRSTDGAIVDFRKDSTTVGSIGTVDGDLLVHSSAAGHKGLRFGNGYVAPTNNAGATEDNTTDLGLSSQRFKDLYLSGGVYLGGTGAANKLEDYEEGTWTPTIIGATSGTATVNVVTNSYTKIGNTVRVDCYLNLSDVTGISGSVRLSGLPFTGSGYSPITVTYCNLFSFNEATDTVSGFTESGAAYVNLLFGSSSVAIPSTDANATNGTIMFQATYKTTQ